MIVSVSFSNYLVLQDWNYRTHNTDKNWISTRTKSSTRRIIISEGRRFSEILRSEACTRWENEESSRTASWRLLNTKIERKSWDDTKSHFSVAGNARSDEFHEWFRKLSRSGIESQWEDCLAFPVNLRWSQVLVPCWAATNACNLTHGKRLDYRKTFLVINFVHLIHTEIINNEFIILCHFHRIGSSAYWFKNSCRKRWCKWGAQIQCRHLQEGPSTRRSFFRCDIQQDSMVGQQRQQISELQFHKFFTPFFLLEDTIQKSDDYLFWFSIGGNVMDQRSRECRLIGGTKTSRSIAGKDFQKIEMLDAGIAFVLNKIIQNSHFKKNVSLEEQNAQKEDRFPRGRQSRSWFTTTFVCVALRTQHWITLIYSLLLSVMTTFRNSIQDGMKFCCRCQQFHQMMSWKVFSNWGYMSLRNLELFRNCTTRRFIRRYRCPIITNWRRSWKGGKFKNFDCKTLTPDAGESKLEQWSRIEKGFEWHWRRKRWKGICYQWQEKGQCSRKHVQTYHGITALQHLIDPRRMASLKEPSGE